MNFLTFGMKRTVLALVPPIGLVLLDGSLSQKLVSVLVSEIKKFVNFHLSGATKHATAVASRRNANFLASGTQKNAAALARATGIVLKITQSIQKLVNVLAMSSNIAIDHYLGVQTSATALASRSIAHPRKSGTMILAIAFARLVKFVQPILI